MSQPLRSIVDLEELVQALPPEDRERFGRIFRLDTTTGELLPPAFMHAWIQKYFGSVDAVRKQRIVKVTNLITMEGSLFNELRASRPMETAAGEDLLEKITQSAGDPFCHPLDGTPEDVFGRVKGTRSVTASNVAKCDGFHGLLIFDEHNPLVFDAAAVKDSLDTALAWARKAHCED